MLIGHFIFPTEISFCLLSEGQNKKKPSVQILELFFLHLSVNIGKSI